MLGIRVVLTQGAHAFSRISEPSSTGSLRCLRISAHKNCYGTRELFGCPGPQVLDRLSPVEVCQNALLEAVSVLECKGHSLQDGVYIVRCCWPL